VRGISVVGSADFSINRGETWLDLEKIIILIIMIVSASELN